MRQEEFKVLIHELNKIAKATMDLKQPEYTSENENVLHNFVTTGERLNISALKVWGIFMEKQISSINAHINNCNINRAETIESRFADVLNYAYLGLALFKERDK